MPIFTGVDNSANLTHSKLIKVHYGTLRRRANNYGLFGRILRRKLLMSNKSMEA